VTFLTLALDGGEWPNSRSGRFTSGERALIVYCTGGYVGPRASLDAVGKERTLSSACNRNPGRLICNLVTVPTEQPSSEYQKLEQKVDKQYKCMFLSL
jgi:hypothetical protein